MQQSVKIDWLFLVLITFKTTTIAPNIYLAITGPQSGGSDCCWPIIFLSFPVVYFRICCVICCGGTVRSWRIIAVCMCHSRGAHVASVCVRDCSNLFVCFSQYFISAALPDSFATIILKFHSFVWFCFIILLCISVPLSYISCGVPMNASLDPESLQVKSLSNYLKGLGSRIVSGESGGTYQSFSWR